MTSAPDERPPARGEDGGRRLCIPAAEPALSLAVRVWEGGDPPVLFLHGFGEGSYVWTGIAPTIAGRRQAFALDFRGHGESDWDPLHRYRRKDHVDDVASVIESLNLGRCVLVGHSLGAAAAVDVAVRCPATVEALVLVDYAPEVPDRSARFVSWEFESSHHLYDSHAEYVQWLRSTRHLAGADQLSRIAAHALRCRVDGRYELRRDPAMLAAREAEPGRSDDAWSALTRLRCQTLLVRGAGSSMLSRAMAERMVSEISCCRLDVIPMAGHGVMTDNPSALGASVSRFLAGLE